MLNNFIYTKNKSLFTKELEAGHILDEAVVFIADTKEIWNHGTYFDCSTTNFEEILNNYVDKTAAQNYVDKTTELTITGLKTFTNVININNLLKIRPNVYPGEFKVTRADNDKGFMIRVNKDSTDDVLPLEILTTDGFYKSYQYDFPKTSGTVALGIRMNNKTHSVNLDDGLIHLDVSEITKNIDITYAELKALKDYSMLLAGVKYRIIDYVTTTNGRELSSSANHKFDIIVTALTSDRLSEFASACHPKIIDGEYNYEVTNPYFGYNISPTNWSNVGINNIPAEINNLGFVASDDGDVRTITIERYNSSDIICTEGSIKVIWLWLEGSKKINILGSELIRTSDNVVVSSDFHIGSTGTYNNDNIYTLVVPENGTYKFKFYIDGKSETVDSSCTIYGYKVEDYFKNSNLSAWEIKYSIDNDLSKYRWASSDGKGVIYYMKDEYCNEAFYDFKNIKFNDKYTFSYTINNTLYDGSVKYGNKCNHNSIEADMITSGSYKGLSKIYFENTSDSSECSNNVIKNNCWDILFGDNCYSNNIGVSCEKIYFGNNMNNIHIGNKCTNIAFIDSNNNGLEACRMIELGDQCNNVNIISMSEPSYSENKWLQNIKISNNISSGNVYVDILNSNRTLCVTTSESGELIQFYESDLFNKQDVISDIEQIRTNANSGAEALQLLDQKQNVLIDGESIKTINGESLLGPGDIQLQTGFSVTYSELVTLRDENKLIPGSKYRITDYVTTTSLYNTQSSKHPFDIIVTALTNNTLSEDAKVCLREGDTYFENNNLEAWEIKYCLDNDRYRFYWADDSGQTIVDSSNVNINLQLLNGNKFIDPFYPTYYINIDGTGEYSAKGDFFVEFGRATSPDGVENQLCIYKTTEEYEEEGADYPDQFFYCGKEKFDGVIYDKWQKSELGSWFIGENDYNIPQLLYILTDQITVGDISYTPIAKGVIYYMKDEFNNECPYDFKNIMFKINSPNFLEDFYYTFSHITNSEVNDMSLTGKCLSNIIKESYEDSSLVLNNNVFISTNEDYVLNFIMNRGLINVIIELRDSTYFNRIYETRVAYNSSGEIKIYCEADLIL